jgi:hypothetical protein
MIMWTRKEIREKLVDGLESLMIAAYSWVDNKKEIIGEVAYFWHIYAIFTVITLIIVSHIFYPVFWFQFVVFCITAIVWLQHILLRTCICTSLEIRFLGKDIPLAVDTILNLFSIPVSRESRMGVTLLLSTIATGLLGLELVARSVLAFRGYLGLSTFA